LSDTDHKPEPEAPVREPILNLPPAVKALLIANLAVHGVRLLLPAEIDFGVVLTFGFIPARYTLPGLFGWPALVSPASHMFLHGGFMHLLVNMVTLMAFGAGVERRIGGPRFVAFALVCGLVGAAAHLAVYPFSIAPVIGASGAISGLFGGVLRFLTRRHGPAAPMAGIWPVALLWIGASLLFGLTGLPGEGPGGGATIAWAAHIGGFLAGLLLFPLFDRQRPGRES